MSNQFVDTHSAHFQQWYAQTYGSQPYNSFPLSLRSQILQAYQITFPNGDPTITVTIDTGYKPILTDPLRYEIPDDVHRRLHRTILRYQGIPVSIDGIGGSLNIRITKLGETKYWKTIHSSDVDLDISSPPIGYINYTDGAWYLQRIPVRRQLQGLYPDACYFNPAYSPQANQRLASAWSMLTSKAFIATINNEYPKWNICLNGILNNKIVSSAFHRKFAFTKDDIGLVKLKHMNETIGWIPPKKDYVVIPDEKNNPIFEKYFKNQGMDIR